MQNELLRQAWADKESRKEVPPLGEANEAILAKGFEYLDRKMGPAFIQRLEKQVWVYRKANSGNWVSVRPLNADEVGLLLTFQVGVSVPAVTTVAAPEA